MGAAQPEIGCSWNLRGNQNTAEPQEKGVIGQWSAALGGMAPATEEILSETHEMLCNTQELMCFR